MKASRNPHLHNQNKRKREVWRRRSRQSWLLFRVIFNEFQEFFIISTLAFSLSVAMFYLYYPRAELPHQTLSIGQMAYYTWLMIFFESPLQYVDDWRLSPLFFLLPLLGLITVAEGVVHLGNLLFHRKRYTKEWQRMIAATFENHIIVCGLGNVGVRVVQHLRSFSEDVIVIEADPSARFIHEITGMDVPVLTGDARDSTLLEEARVRQAKAIIAVTDNDLANLEAVLTAREVNPTIRVVMRMFDQKLAKKIEKSLLIDRAYSSSARSSRLFAQAAISENILDSFEFSGETINAVQMTIEANTTLVGRTIDEVRHHYEVTILLQEKLGGELDWNPSPSNTLSVGDKLLLMTDRDGWRRVQEGAKQLTLPNN